MAFILRQYLLIAFVAAVLFPSVSLGDTRESEGILFGRKQENLIRETSDDGKGPSKLVGNQVYVVAYMGAAYGSVLVLGSTSTAPQRLARILDDWQHGHGLNRTVKWSNDEDGAAASLKLLPAAHIGLTSSRTSLEFGSILQAFKAGGFQTYGVGRIGPYADLEGAGTSFGGTSSKLYDLSSLPDAAKISVRAEMASWEAVLLALWPFFVPLAILIGFGVAAYYGRLESVPIAKRRTAYQKLVLGTAFGSIGIHALSFMFLMTTGGLAKVCDLWFGTSSVAVLMPMIPAGMLFLIPMLLLSKGVEKKLFGADPGWTVALPPPTGKEKEFVQRRMWVALGATAVFFGIYVAITFIARPKDPGLRVLGMPFLFFAIFVPNLLARRLVRGSAEFEIGPADRDLSDLAGELSMRLQVKVPKLSIVRTRLGRAYIFGSASLAGIRISQAAVDNLTREEMRFLLAHELAHVKQSHGNQRVLMLVPAFAFFLAIQFCVFMAPPPHPAWVLPASFGLLTAYVFGAASWMVRKSRDAEFEADRLAVDATGDPMAAIACLEKCAHYSALPHLHDLDTARHPSHPRRIDALRAMMS